MARKLDPKCAQCRREGEKLYLKGDRCQSPKCALVKRNYAPGVHGAKNRRRLTVYGQQLREKQKAKRIYGVLERQFRKYFKQAINKSGDTGENLVKLLEMRFDNVVYRLGLAKSRAQARQDITHKHFLINNKKVNIPSHSLKVGDIVTVCNKSLLSPLFQNLSQTLEKHELATWLTLDVKTFSGKVLSEPQSKELTQTLDVKSIVEYYSR